MVRERQSEKGSGNFIGAAETREELTEWQASAEELEHTGTAN